MRRGTAVLELTTKKSGITKSSWVADTSIFWTADVLGCSELMSFQNKVLCGEKRT